ERIEAAADRRVRIELAEAEAKAEVLRGQGDAEAAEIYASAYGKDPAFFSFYNSMDAYRTAFSSRSDLLVVDPASDFFRYFNQSGGNGQAVPAGAASQPLQVQ